MQSHGPSPVLVGRDRLLARLAGDGRRARTHGARATLVCGEAGVGKSRLIEEYLARADAGRTAVGGCLELGADGVPFAPFTTLLRHLAREEGAPPSAAHSRELARLLPELGRAPEGADDGRARLFESVLTFLEERSRPGGLLVVVEDLHWADASTRDLLVFLLRNLGDVPVHLLVSVRTDDIHRTHPLRGLLPELERLPRVGRLDVGPLDRDAVAAQASALRGGALDPAALDLLLERTGGNPLFVESFLHSQDPTGGPIPEGPRGLLLATVERLPDTTRRVLGLAATAGDRVDHPLLAAVALRSGLTEEQLDDALRRAADARVLRATDDGYAFRHALLAEAVHTDLLPGERVRAHRRYAEALAQGVPGMSAADTAVQLAHHAHAARDQPLALTAAWRAADHASSAAAHPEHLALLERVLELWDLVPDAASRVGKPRGEVLRRASRASLDAGHPRRAVDHATDGLRELGVTGYHEPGGPPPGNAELIAGLRHARAHALKEMGRDGALEDLADAIVVLPHGHPLAAAVGSTLAATLMMRNHHAQARRSALRGLEQARAAGDRYSEADLLVTLGTLSSTEEHEAGLRMLADGISLARESGFAEVELRGLNNLGGAFQRIGRGEEHGRVVEEGLRRCAELGVARTQSDPFHLGIAVRLAHQGRFAEAEERLAMITGDTVFMARARTLRMNLAHHRWDLRGVREAMEDFRRLLPEHSSSPSEYLPLRFTDMQVAAEEGRYGEAFDLATAQLGRGEDHPSPFSDELYVLGLSPVGDTVDLLRGEPGREGEVRVLASGLREVFDGFPHGTRHPGLLLLRHQVMAQIGEDPGEALAEAEAAVSLAGDREDVLTEGRIRLVAARAALRAGDRGRAGAHLAVAGRLARRYGLWLFARQAQRLFLRHGLPDPGRPAAVGAAPVPPALTDGSPPGGGAGASATAAPRGGGRPAGLTPREAEVLAEVAKGRTNREIGEALFISAKTVSVHVTNMMAKLGVSNRNAAAVRARELGLG
ncbi:helix-turn-helix transcriptional regulator [Nocardiopsis tropica]|uniref:AAA family ATPase n=1 Tax=Nocardiopsis tropica TaxID=109330 RepID=A0ABV1ZSW7_9ACTN